jgi:uncharacterized circularly permuted ATP-grasp superfamily protein
MLNFNEYATDGFFDELFDEQGHPRVAAQAVVDAINRLPPGELSLRQKAAEHALYEMGITFNVYGDEAGTERIFPFDIVPRVIGPEDWALVEKGLKQRIYALNLFIDDIYHDQKVVKDGVVPAFVIQSASHYREVCRGLKPPQGVWCHITGTDLVRDKAGVFYVLEDNLRCPSGVSYVLENREVMKRTFPQFFRRTTVARVADYPMRLLDMLQWLAPGSASEVNAVVLTPGISNSAYFEHSFLAQQMGVSLVQGCDLVCINHCVYQRTTMGFRRVDVIYRRIDDDFLDPEAFREDSLLGVPGLMEAYRSGNVSLANAPGTGIADDKVVYAYVPEIIKYYLGEDAIVPNVPTYLCWEEKDRAYVLEHIDELVVKAANESGGYGMLIGPHSTKAEQEEFARRITAAPRNYIAQPTLALSRTPTIVDDHFEGRHVDLRPYIIYGEEIYVMPGGLTRVALKKGSLVVNSSQGGGSKDTWVISSASESNGNGHKHATSTQLQSQTPRST